MSLFRSKLQDALYFLHNLDGYLFHWNLYHIHPTCFIFVIIVASVIFYGSNKSFPLSYSDATVLCTSAVTNTGLTTVNLSALITRQQAILIILMLMGDLTIVTVVLVYIRKSYFKKRLQELVGHNTVAGQVTDDIERRIMVTISAGKSSERGQSMCGDPNLGGEKKNERFSGESNEASTRSACWRLWSLLRAMGDTSFSCASPVSRFTVNAAFLPLIPITTTSPSGLCWTERYL